MSPYITSYMLPTHPYDIPYLAHTPASLSRAVHFAPHTHVLAGAPDHPDSEPCPRIMAARARPLRENIYLGPTVQH